MFSAVLLQLVHLDISGVVGQPGPQRMEKVVELGRLLLGMEDWRCPRKDWICADFHKGRKNLCASNFVGNIGIANRNM